MNRRKVLTQEEIDTILFDDTDESDLEIEDDGWGESSLLENNEIFDTSEENEKTEIDDTDSFLESDADEDIIWSEDIENENIKISDFHSSCGPVHNLPVGSTPLQFLKLFFTDEIMETIRINTNKYAEFCEKKRGYRDENWSPIETISELWLFFTIMLIMSINHLPRILDYWSTNPILGNEMVKRLMSRNRFKKIKHYFHVSDKNVEKKRDDENFSYTQKLEPCISQLKEKCMQHFNPYQDISIDEAIIQFKGRLGIVQYMPLKPDKRGLKMWMMCTAHLGYTLNFDLYSGKNSKMNKSSKGLGYDVVHHLTNSLKSKGHVIYFDRFFTSVDLMIDLQKRGLSACGTVNTNRKKMPKEMKNVKLIEDHESKTFQCMNFPNLLYTTWLDKKQIYMLSTNTKNEICEVNRRKGSEKQVVPSPTCFAKYNKNMGGVDLADQRRKYFTSARKSYKWWMYLFSFLLDTSLNNSYIIYLTSNYPCQKKTFQLYDFKLKIIEELSETINYSKKRKASDNQSYNQHQHKRQKINGRKRTCVLCRKNGKKTFSGGYVESSFECSICRMCMCKTCF